MQYITLALPLSPALGLLVCFFNNKNPKVKLLVTLKVPFHAKREIRAFLDCYHSITDTFGPIFQTINTVLKTKTHFSKLLTHFTCLQTCSNLLSVFC